MHNDEKQILAAITADTNKDQKPVVASPETRRSRRKRINEINQRILSKSYSPIVNFLNIRF